MKNKKGFTILEILIVIILLGIIMSIAVLSVNKNIEKSKNRAAFVTVNNVIDSIKYNEDGTCLYNYRFQEKSEKINLNTLVVISYLDEDVQKYAVYAEINKDVPFIDIDDFSKIKQNSDINSYVSESNEEKASNYFDNFFDNDKFVGSTECKNIYE